MRLVKSTKCCENLKIYIDNGVHLLYICVYTVNAHRYFSGKKTKRREAALGFQYKNEQTVCEADEEA